MKHAKKEGVLDRIISRIKQYCNSSGDEMIDSVTSFNEVFIHTIMYIAFISSILLLLVYVLDDASSLTGTANWIVWILAVLFLIISSGALSHRLLKEWKAYILRRK